ncbi:MAG TPA: hypothetical protein VMW10_05755 [Alphaproteobacteria bacterium]|nr:hypothetical protein [Alphaproteobacteria bacterium]
MMLSKNFKYTSFVFISIFSLISQSYAVRTNGKDADEKYTELAEDSQLSAVGYVVRHKKEEEKDVSQFTATLVEENIAITAAHCFSDLFPKDKGQLTQSPITMELDDTYMCFDRQISWKKVDDLFNGNSDPSGSFYRIKAVTLHPDYIADVIEYGGNTCRNDVAFLSLEETPFFRSLFYIKPIPLLDHAVGEPVTGTFLGYGKGDTGISQKRAASQSVDLKYYQPIYYAPFFEPLEKGEQAIGFTSHIRQRNEGNKYWHTSGLPYGIGEPGDSGGPLLTKVRRDGKFVPCIYGIISGGGKNYTERKTNIEIQDEIDQMLPATEMYGKYHSSFSSLIYNCAGGVLINSMIKELLETAKNQ